MPGWLATHTPLINGILSAGGELFANHQNNAQAVRQMKFQERMSSTAAQRAVKDYRLAGLNPALAYDKPASSPGGASAVMGNIAEKGVNSAMAAKSVMANIALTEASTRKADAEARSAAVDADLKDPRRVLSPGQTSYMSMVDAERAARVRDLNFTGKMQPHDLRIRELDREIRGYDRDFNRLKARTANYGTLGFDTIENAGRRGLNMTINGATALQQYLRDYMLAKPRSPK